MSKHTISDLYQMQSMPLNIKVRMTQNRIRGWVDEYGEDGVYVSFSGGKDSTVLLDIVRKMYPNVLAVFVDKNLKNGYASFAKIPPRFHSAQAQKEGSSHVRYL